MSPLDSWCWDVSATWTLWSISVGSDLRCCLWFQRLVSLQQKWLSVFLSWEPVSSQHLMVFAPALEDTFKVVEIFCIDWLSNCINTVCLLARLGTRNHVCDYYTDLTDFKYKPQTAFNVAPFITMFQSLSLENVKDADFFTLRLHGKPCHVCSWRYNCQVFW